MWLWLWIRISWCHLEVPLNHVQCAHLATLDALITNHFQSKWWTKSAKICMFLLAGFSFIDYSTSVCCRLYAFAQLFFVYMLDTCNYNLTLVTVVHFLIIGKDFICVTVFILSVLSWCHQLSLMRLFLVALFSIHIPLAYCSCVLNIFIFCLSIATSECGKWNMKHYCCIFCAQPLSVCGRPIGVFG